MAFGTLAPITFAHRGGVAGLGAAARAAAENSIEAFLRAKEAGVGGVESDVRLSADGVPVLAHDAKLRRGLRRATIAREPADELAAWGVPRLADLYEAVGTDLDVSLDVKSPDAAEPTIAVARRAGGRALERLWLCSPDLAALESLRERHDAVRLVHSTTRGSVDENIEAHAARLAHAGIDAFNLHRREWSTGLVVLFHRFDVLAFAWDVQEVRHLREVLAHGVDAVYSDFPDRMVATVAEWCETTA